MTRRKKQLFISSGLLAVLIVIALVLINKKGGFSGTTNTLTEDIGEFAIDDTASISKIIITDQDKNTGEVTRKHEGYWEINKKFRARIESIDLILYTTKEIEVRNQVPIAGRENTIRNMSVNYKKVEFFDANDNWIKTWYVGSAAKDNEGSNMILEDENGKAEIPCITYIPGFVGQLSSRFFCEEKTWRFTGVFNYEPKEIASIKVMNYDSLVESFEIKSLGKNNFSLYNAFNKPVDLFDTAAIRQYVLNYKKIHFQSFNAGTLTLKQEDSLRNAKPHYKISVTDTKGKLNEIKIYHKHLPDVDDMGNPWDFDYPWDPVRGFAVLQSGEVVIIQYSVFDHILWPIYAFTNSSRLMQKNS